MSKDKNQNDASLDAETSGAVAALSCMKETLDQMVDPTLPDTVNDAMASLSAMLNPLAQAADSSIPNSLTAATDTLQYKLKKLPPMDYTGIMADVVNTTESFYSNCFRKERLAEIFSMVRLVGDSPEVKRLQAMLDAYGRDGVINQEGVHAYIDDFGRYWEHAAKAKNRDESAVPAQNLTIIKLISNPQKEDLPKGSKYVFEELSKSAAANLAQSNDVLFDVKSKEFYRRETPDQKISPKRVSMAVSAQQVFEDISQDALIAFESKLFENASFACQDQVGKMIHDRIEAWTDRVDLEQDVYYHARRIEDGCDYYNDDEMMKAPTNVTSQGRYNDIGRSYYYIADTKEGAIKEITKHCGSKKPRVQVVGLHPTQHVEILDLSEKIKGRCAFLEHLRRQARTTRGVVREYMLPNYVANCCRDLGITGIKYKSSQSAKYNCIVLWNDGYFDFVDGTREIFE